MSIFLRESKTDQYNDGALLTHHLADEASMSLCVVRALRDMALVFPERFTTEKHRPLFRWESGKAVTRDEVRRFLAQGAAAFGVPEGKMNTHSLRVGGASALFQATGGNIGLVKRLGRWASDAFEGYIWEDRELTEGLASKMIQAPWHIHGAS